MKCGRIIEAYGSLSLGWVRVFGVGLWWKDTGHNRLYFSERSGRRPPSFTVGAWHFRILRRPGAKRRNLTIDIRVALGMYRIARRRGLSRRVAWYWVRDTWHDLPVFRAERGIDA